MTTLLFSIMLFLTSYTDNSPSEREYHIKDSRYILKYDSTTLYTGWYYVVDSSNSFKRQLNKSDETYYLDPKPIVKAKNIATFDIYESNYDGKKYFGLTMRLDKEGTENWSSATRKAEMTGMRLAFILDNILLQELK